MREQAQRYQPILDTSVCVGLDIHAVHHIAGLRRLRVIAHDTNIVRDVWVFAKNQIRQVEVVMGGNWEAQTLATMLSLRFCI
jgi:hypothetical protein